MTTTITGEVERVTFENEETSFRVIKLGSIDGARRPGTLAVVGTFQAVGPGARVRVTGDFVDDPRHGEQFRADTLVPVAPATLAGLEKYLGSGLIPGVGPSRARSIVRAFQLDTLAILDESPERLAEVKGISRKQAREIAAVWSERREMNAIMLLLQTHGASPALAARIHERYGARSASVVQRSPYKLALEVRGIGFKTADRLARSLGIAGDHPDRAQAGVLHELGMLADQGHVACPRPLLVERAAAMLEIGPEHVEAAIDALWAAERVAIERGEPARVYLARLDAAERRIAAGLATLLASPGHDLPGLAGTISAFERAAGIELAPQQRRAVEAAAEQKVVVVTGGPGVGKTTIVRAILGVFERARLTVRLAAPTGRAAKRMAEATRREASTIHRLLDFDPRSGRFQRDAEHPLDTDALILDEASMIDVELGAALFDALAAAARLVVVGDADQLPSVGPGALLRDLVSSEVVPVVRLDEIFRQGQASRIVTGAHRVLHGEMPESANADDPDADFFVIKRREPDEAAAVILELVTSRIPRRFGLSPASDIQVLTPMHRGAAGTIGLNAALQAALNPEGPALEVRGQTLRVGDKVMQTRNDYERETYNGDIGIVESVEAEARKLAVRFDGRRVEYHDAALESLVLSYATSIHKSQGSEYPAVVIPLLTTHFVMLSRNLLYTAITRAKRLCVLVADPRALALALAETRREERMTSLAERLRSALATGS
ncbi:MAG: ATP-dependent RecD-like DNA helicase [Sorangiineae bacterium]|nr:ATP-dependent RecD-like DNA helicase [Polyangiaceae bacterium]MEB2321870.1 ATP-dependent RecD-like DNA helicase [Sorangiineae bacterium]